MCLKLRGSDFLVLFCVFILRLNATDAIFLVIPEDVATGFAAIYGFSPRIFTGNDHRLGFGFRFGNHADLQVMYELGPQQVSRPLQPIRIRSASYSERVYRRRPVLEFLLRLGLLKEASYRINLVDDDLDQPR